MRNKHSTGRAIKRSKRIRHRGVMYRLSGGNVWRESDGRYVGSMFLSYAGDARAAIDRILSEGRRPKLRPTPKRRRYGRIHPERRVL